MSKKNLVILCLVLAAIALLAVAGLLLPRAAVPADAPALGDALTVTTPHGEAWTASPLPTAQAAATAAPSPSAGAQTAQPLEEAEARAFLLVTVDDVIYQPIALTQEGTYTLTQKDKGAENVIAVTPDGVRMASSTCENQDCVEQGEVTLDNRAERLLGGYIVCLPNGVTLELLTREEAMELVASIVQ